MDKKTVREIVQTKSRIPMTTVKSLRYYSFQIIILSFTLVLFIPWSKDSYTLYTKSNITFLIIVVVFSSLTALLQYLELKLKRIPTSNSDNENFKILRNLFRERGFQIEMQNQHYFKVTKRYRSCVFYFYLIDGIVCYTYSYNLDFDFFSKDSHILHLLINLFRRRIWKKILKSEFKDLKESKTYSKCD